MHEENPLITPLRCPPPPAPPSPPSNRNCNLGFAEPYKAFGRSAEGRFGSVLTELSVTEAFGIRCEHWLCMLLPESRLQ